MSEPETPECRVRPAGEGDRSWVERFISDRWGTPDVVAHGTVYRPAELPAYVAEAGGTRAGLVTYTIEGGTCEIVSIDAVEPGRGTGTALLDAVRAEARRSGCFRLWLITTNDNVEALAFYQKRGFELVRVHRDAMKHSRQIKPQIPEVAANGIPIRDEIELEMWLSPR